MEEKKTKKVMGPILGWILFTLLGFELMGDVGNILGAAVASLLGNPTTISYIVTIVIILLYVLIYNLANRKTFDGCFKPQNMKIGFLILIPMLVIMLVISIVNALTKVTTLAIVGTNILVALRAGICEEIVYRAVPAAHMMRSYDKEKNVMTVAILTSIVFGLIHLFNIRLGANVPFTILQTFSAFALGMLLCASYLRSGSIVPAMVMHFAYDTVGMMWQGTYGSNGIMSNASIPVGSWILNIGVFVLCLTVALYALRPAKRGEIIDIWAKKWKKAE